MLKNYVTIAVRILLHNKVYVAINLGSLGFALACCILSYLNYDYRASFDETHTRTDHIYRLNSLRAVDGGTQLWAVAPMPLAELAANNFSGAGRFARLYPATVVVKQKEHVFGEKLYYADKNLFNFFNLPLRYGSYAGFEERQTLILSERMAAKYFGTQMPVGRKITLINASGQAQLFTVSGVLEKAPLNSSFQFDLVTSFAHAPEAGGAKTNDWTNANLVTAFVEVKNRQSIPGLEKGLQAYAAPHNRARADWRVKGFYFQPFREIGASSDIDFGNFVYGSQLEANPRGVLVIVPAVMSLFILLITCFNFTNIAIAFAGNRLKEIGIRKVMGGARTGLILQFLTENLILCGLAAVLALAFVAALLPLFNQVTGNALALDLGNNGVLWLFLILLPAGTALVAGLYPAVYITSFQPVRVLKGNATVGSAGRFTRFLLTAQLGISCLALIVGIILTHNAWYQQRVDYGYAIDQLAVVQLNKPQTFAALSDALRQNPRVKGIAGTAQQIGDDSYQATVQSEKGEVKAQVAHVGGEAYLAAMDIKLVEGKHLHGGRAALGESVIVNQTLVKALNLTRPLGTRIRVDSTYLTIEGVVEDYKEFGLHGLVPPCILRAAGTDEFNYLVVRATRKDLPQVNKDVQVAWRKIVPDEPYRGFLQTELIEKESYLNAGFVSVAFFLAVVTLLLSASGLFALVSLNIRKRSKEIGMRKILGASVGQIIALINKSFIRIVLVAFAAGSLLGYLLVGKLIFRFIYVYHPPIGPGAFLATLVLIVLSCTLTIGLKVYRAATANPVEALRSE